PHQRGEPVVLFGDTNRLRHRTVPGGHSAVSRNRAGHISHRNSTPMKNTLIKNPDVRSAPFAALLNAVLAIGLACIPSCGPGDKSQAKDTSAEKPVEPAAKESAPLKPAAAAI